MTWFLWTLSSVGERLQWVSLQPVHRNRRLLPYEDFFFFLFFFASSWKHYTVSSWTQPFQSNLWRGERWNKDGRGEKVEKITRSEYLGNNTWQMVIYLTAPMKSPYIELQDYQEKPFGSHSFALRQNALGSKREAGVQTISHLLIVSYTEPPDFISSAANTPQGWD